LKIPNFEAKFLQDLTAFGETSKKIVWTEAVQKVNKEILIIKPDRFLLLS
jgi:hypothetical protein